MVKRESGCPLCGARLDAAALLDACSGLLDAGLGVLAARCPACQGYLEVRPVEGRLDLGYLGGAGSAGRFEVALSLLAEGLAVERHDDTLRVALAGRHWAFSE
ncbi:MAG: hypothetical protein OEL88_10065 [Sterolibacteriaceae bacterium MAG5]|nr:hypothetical protein [Candidatus Nitricoxidireducens bremensis]